MTFGGRPPHHPTRPSSSARSLKGHEDRFEPPRLNGRHGFGQATFAGTHENEQARREPPFGRPWVDESKRPKSDLAGASAGPDQHMWMGAVVLPVGNEWRTRCGRSQCEI